MEEHVEKKEEKELNPDLCSNCQHNKYEEDYSFKLCTECRDSLAKFPIPKWIYAAAVLLLITIILGIASAPENFIAAVHLSRGEKAIDEHRYKTAEKEFLQMLEVLPNSFLANVNLMIVYARTFNQGKLMPLYSKIGDRDIEDKDLFIKSTDALAIFKSIIPLDTSFYSTLQLAGDSIPLIEAVLDTNQKYFPEDYASAYMVADKFYDLKDYRKSEKILMEILEKEKDYRPAIQLLIAIKRNEKECDSAIAFCNRLLTYNVEDESVVAQKAKIELKRKNDKLAAKYVNEAMDMDSLSVFSLEAKAMVQYFSNDKEGSMKTINKIIALEPKDNHYVSERVSKIITGKEIYR